MIAYSCAWIRPKEPAWPRDCGPGSAEDLSRPFGAEWHEISPISFGEERQGATLNCLRSIADYCASGACPGGREPAIPKMACATPLPTLCDRTAGEPGQRRTAKQPLHPTRTVRRGSGEPCAPRPLLGRALLPEPGQLSLVSVTDGPAAAVPRRERRQLYGFIITIPSGAVIHRLPSGPAAMAIGTNGTRRCHPARP
jgi:hypothetical protein